MKVYKISTDRYNYHKRSEFKKTTVNLYGYLVRSLRVDDRIRYCLQDIIEAAVPQKNCGQHVNEWLRRGAFINCDIHSLDTHTHYAEWKDCCELAEAFMYVYREKLSSSGRVRYDSDGYYEKGSTPLPPSAVCSEAATYRLWRALLDKAPAPPTAMIHTKNNLYTTLDFAECEELKRVGKPPRPYGVKKVVKTTIPTVTKLDVLAETNMTKPDQEVKEDALIKKPEPTVEVGNELLKSLSAMSSTNRSSALVSLIEALVSGKKLKIEISLGE